MKRILFAVFACSAIARGFAQNVEQPGGAVPAAAADVESLRQQVQTLTEMVQQLQQQVKEQQAAVQTSGAATLPQGSEPPPPASATPGNAPTLFPTSDAAVVASAPAHRAGHCSV